MRRISDVIAAMLPLIPTNEPDLRHGLSMIAERSDYTAPEIMDQRWHEGAALLGKHLPEPGFLNGWQQAVVAVWTGRQA